MRKGPHPLNVHIGMAASEIARSAYDGSIPPGDIESQFALMLQGIQRYQCYEDAIARPETEKITAFGEMSLLKLRGHSFKGGRIVLLVPSLVNRASIFNLTVKRSMMQFLRDCGMYPVLLNWGEPTNDLAQAHIDDLLNQRLKPALDYIRETYGEAPHVLGYCMGGTLMIPVLSQFPDSARSLSLLASPWDFYAGTQALQKRIKFWYPAAVQGMNGKSYLDQDCFRQSLPV